MEQVKPMIGKARIPLTRVPRAIAELTGGPAPTYRQVYNGVLDGTVPAEQGGNGRYDVRTADVPTIAKHYGYLSEAAA